MDYKITNVKASIKCPSICLDTVVKNAVELKIKHVIYVNYIVIQSCYTYIIFKSRKGNNLNHVNITKIPNLEEIDIAKKYLCDLLKIEIIATPVVDNITVSTRLNTKSTPKELINLFTKHCKITFNQETFPGVFLKFLCGTAIVFHTGCCILIGCKKISDITDILTLMFNILNQNE
jgi:TATA-box binding protein (TBP) (component of TFIID and TFIIIB)